MSDSTDSILLFDHTSGASLAPPATADSATRSQWLTRDAAARLAVRNHLPLAERAHFGQHKTAKALYDAVVAHYPSPATAALGRLLLPYLFPELSAFATVQDLVTHLRTSNARYRSALPADFLDPPPPPPPPLPPMMSGLLLLLAGSAAAARARVAGVVAVAAGVVVVEAVEVAEVVAAVGVVAGVGALVAVAVEAVGVAVVGAVGVVAFEVELFRGEVLAVARGSSSSSSSIYSRPFCPSSFVSGLLSMGRLGVVLVAFDIFYLDYDAILAAMYALSVSAEGDCYRCVPLDPCIEAAALGACECALLGTALAEALHTFTLDSGPSRCFFCEIITLTPLSAPVPVRLADPSGGPVLARSSTVLPCLAVPPGSLSGLHLPLLSGGTTAFVTPPCHVFVACTPASLFLDRERYFLLVVDDYTRYTTVFPLRSKVECPFAVLYAAHQLNLWPHVSLPETSPTLHWTGKVGDAPVFWVGSSCALVRDTSTDKLSSRVIPCVFHGFPPDAPGWQFYHPTSRHVLPSQDVTFYESVPFYRLFPYCSAPLPPPPLFLAPGPLLVDPLPSQGSTPSGVFQVDPLPGAVPVEVVVDSSAARSAASGGAAFGGAEPGGAEPEGEEPGGADSEGAGSGGAEPGGAEPGGPGAGGAGAGDPGAGGAGAGGTGAGESVARGTRARGAGAGDPRAGGTRVGGTGAGGVRGGGTRAGDPGAGGAGAGGHGAGGTLQPDSPLPVPSPYAEQTYSFTERREPESPPALPVRAVRTGRRVPRPHPPLVPGTHMGEVSPGRTCLRSGAAGAGGSLAGGTGAGGVGATSLGGAGVSVGAGGTGGAGFAGPKGARTRGTGAAGAGGAGGAGAGDPGTGGAGAGGAGAQDPGVGGAGAGGAGAVGARAGNLGAGGAGAGGTGAGGAGSGGTGAVDHGAGGAGAWGIASGDTGAGGTVQRRPFFVMPPPSSLPPPESVLRQVLSLPSSTCLPPSLLSPPPCQSWLQLQPDSSLPAPSPYAEQPYYFTERREPECRPTLPFCALRTGLRVPCPRPPPDPGTHVMALRPSSVPLRVPLPPPPTCSLLAVPDPESIPARAASPTVPRLLASVVTDPSFESTAASALVAELVDFAATFCLDYATSVVAESESACPSSVGGECALGTNVLEDRREDFKCLAAAVPHLVAMLLASEGDPDASDIPTPRSYAETITGPYSSQWQTAMDAEMASWKSTGTYVDAVPPFGANILDGMWIFRVKRLPGSSPAFKARYVARGFSQRQGVDFFHTFSLTPKMTTLWVLLHVATQRDYELHSLDFSTAFLQGSLHEEIRLRRPPGFTGSFPAGTQWSVRLPIYSLRQAPCEWHDTLRMTLLSPFYVLVFVDDLVFATTDTEALALVKSELQKRHTCTDLGELCSYFGLQITRDRARRTITLTQSHMVHRVVQRFGFRYSSPQSTPLPTGHSLSGPPLDESVEQSGTYREAAKRVLRYLCSTSAMGLVLGGRGTVVLTRHADASWVDDLATQRSSLGYTFSLGSGSVSWRSTRSSSVLSSSCEAEIYTGAMAAQELRWLTYLLTDLGERPCSSPVPYIDNKAMIALCQGHRLEHRPKHIAMRYFLAPELQQRGQLRLTYVATTANTADIFTSALQSGDHQRFCTVLGLQDLPMATLSPPCYVLSRSLPTAAALCVTNAVGSAFHVPPFALIESVAPVALLTPIGASAPLRLLRSTRRKSPARRLAHAGAMRDPLLKRGSAAVCGAVAAKAAAGGDGGRKHEGSEVLGGKCEEGEGAGGKGSGDEELKGLRKTVSGKNLRETKEKETMLKERQKTEKREKREKKANKGKKEKKEKKERVEKKEKLKRAKTREEGDGEGASACERAEGDGAKSLLKGRAAEEGVAGRGGAEEGDEAQPTGAEASRKGESSAEDCAEEEAPERSWRTVFSAASSADRSPKPSRGLLTDPDPVPIQSSRLGDDFAPSQSFSFGVGDRVPDQSGRSGGGWCGLCGDGSGWVQCGACDGKGAYATAPGLGGVKGKVGWALCKTCYGWKATPCVLCAVSGAEEWLQWQEHAMRHPVKVKVGGEEVGRRGVEEKEK
ncbi:unnamed protein product [Closterium sp. NIES-53]